MMKIATGSKRNPVAVGHPAVQAAFFDMTVVSATGFDETIDSSGNSVDLFVKGLTILNRSTALLDSEYSGETGRPLSLRSEAPARRAKLHKVIGPRVGDDDGRHFHGYPGKVFFAAAKLLCIDAQLFNLKDGSEFARTLISTARRAGRTTALLCADLPTAFNNRHEIVDSFGGILDYVVGEPPAVLSLFGLCRIDTLVPRMMQLGTGLVLHRIDYPSISIRPKSGAVEIDDSKISREMFWSEFVPSVLDKFLVRGSKTD